MASSLSCVIDPITGCTAPTYADILSQLQQGYLGIFGSDAYIANDSMDGQLLQIFALAIADSNAATIQCYNSYSPAFAQGAGLSSQVKINGLRRLSASNSTAPVFITGTAGTTIINGIVADAAGQQWSLPPNLVISNNGDCYSLATAINLGAIPCPIGAMNIISSPTLGWQTVTNTQDATLGAPIETDNILRIRQSVSTEYPALAVVEGVSAAVANVFGVIQSVVYENPTGQPDSNGVPAHSIAVCTRGGDPNSIANAIALKKSPGCGTFGTTSVQVLLEGYPTTINFFLATDYALSVIITLNALPGYTDRLGAQCAQLLTNYISNIQIGQDIYLTNSYAACVGPSYHIVSIAYSVNGGPSTVADVIVPYNALASLQVANVSIVIA